MGVTKPISPVPLFSEFLALSWTHFRYWIFDRCPCSLAAGTPVKYECDSMNLKGTFARLKILLIEKLMNRALVTLAPQGARWSGCSPAFMMWDMFSAFFFNYQWFRIAFYWSDIVRNSQGYHQDFNNCSHMTSNTLVNSHCAEFI